MRPSLKNTNPNCKGEVCFSSVDYIFDFMLKESAELKERVPSSAYIYLISLIKPTIVTPITTNTSRY